MLAVAHYLIGHLSYSQVPALAKRHKVEAKKDSTSAQELLAEQVGSYDEAELCKFLLEISLLDSAYQRSTASRPPGPRQPVIARCLNGSAFLETWFVPAVDHVRPRSTIVRRWTNSQKVAWQRRILAVV